MRKLLMTCILLSGCAFGQIQSENGVDKFQKVIEVQKSKSEIYKAIKMHLNQTTSKVRNVLDIDDETLGVLSYTERMEPKYTSEFFRAEPSYKVTIEIKDGRVRYTASPININENLLGAIVPRTLSQYKDDKYDSLILDNEEKLKQETKDRKIKEIEKLIAKYKKERQIKLDIIKSVENGLDENVDNLTALLNSEDNW